jgi:hypothetical protein
VCASEIELNLLVCWWTLTEVQIDRGFFGKGPKKQAPFWEG